MKVYIVNVSTNEIRRNHMLQLISKNSCLLNNSFIQDGDLEAISKDTLAKYFGGKLNTLRPAVSCAYKHILAYFEIIKQKDDEYSLILEDDIFLNEGFCSDLSRIVSEIKDRKLDNFIISLEDSNLKYVKGSERKKNTLLYRESRCRATGAYIVDKKAAKSIVLEITQNKCNLPIDWFLNHCSDKGIINIYWTHPTFASQGSVDGKMKSLITNKPVGLIRILTFKINRLYKKFIYRVR